MKKVNSKLPLNYVTIKVTQSRIDKGLLAIPTSLIDIFPKDSKKLFLVDENGNVEKKTFTPYSTSSRECRIGGLKMFYDKYNVVNGDELVIQLLDDKKYRILPDKLFQEIVQKNMIEFNHAITDEEVKISLANISKITNMSEIDVLQNEFVFLSKQEIKGRKRVVKAESKVRESVTPSIRKMLMEIYGGKCQVTGFTFLTRENKPYFEIHHIDKEKGNHVKNLLVVSPNTHAQFEKCHIEQHFDDNGWLRSGKFNDETFTVFQAIDKLQQDFEKEIHFT